MDPILDELKICLESRRDPKESLLKVLDRLFTEIDTLKVKVQDLQYRLIDF